MKRLLALLLCFVTILSLVACAQAPGETTASTEANTEIPESTGPIDDYPYPKINEKLTWDAINAIPVKRSDMTIVELRQLCVDFFRFAKTALWIPNSDFKYLLSTTSNKTDEMKKGTIYGGLPYIGSANGSIYRLMDYMDPETNVVDIRRAASNPSLFGNQCSGGAYWGWARVINSANYGGTPSMVQANGFLRLGPYTYDDSRPSNSTDNTTISVCNTNGEQIMYQSYALLQPADGLVYYTTAGHVMMCASTAHVEYTESGAIDGDKSYVTVIDQGAKWFEATNSKGDTYTYKHNVDVKFTFKQLFEDYYMPFTFAEFLGTDPVEETVCTFSHTASTITAKELFSSTVYANYGISDAYAIVKDSTGKEVYRHAVRAKWSHALELPFARNSDNVDKWGTLDVSSGDFTVEIVVQLGTGERPTVYTGKLVP